MLAPRSRRAPGSPHRDPGSSLCAQPGRSSGVSADMRRIGGVLLAALACAAPAIAAKPPPKPPKGNPNLTIRSTAPVVTFGRTVTLSGTAKDVAAGTAVEAQANPFPYSGFKPTGKIGVVDPNGNYSIPGVVVSMNTQFRVNAKTSPPSESAAVFVRVRLRVSFKVNDSTPKRGSRVRFSGRVAPAHDGKPVLIQKKTASGYKTVTRTTMVDNGTATSKYSKKVKIRRSGTYRVIAESADQDHQNGTSRVRTLKVH